MRALIIFLFLIHGGIHLMGFLKAYQWAEIGQLTQPVSRPLGLLWLLATTLFLIATVAFLFKSYSWPLIAFAAVLLSQILVFLYWQDAKFGSLPNLLLLVVALGAFGMQRFERIYRQDVHVAVSENPAGSGVVAEGELKRLPPPVQRYLRYTGVVGKPRVYNMRLVFEGQMREKGKPWFPFTSEQHNFFEHPSRLFFMKARFKGLPTYGYHTYRATTAGMLIKLAGWIPVVDLKDPLLFPTETVTFLNDLCLFAPSALLDERIEWEPIDALSARVIFTNQGSRVSAVLYFDETGRLTNFVSEDRYDISEMKAYPFSTPVGNYKDFSGYRLPGFGEAVWHYPDGEFAYGEFTILSVEYNVANPHKP